MNPTIVYMDNIPVEVGGLEVTTKGAHYAQQVVTSGGGLSVEMFLFAILGLAVLACIGMFLMKGSAQTSQEISNLKAQAYVQEQLKTATIREENADSLRDLKRELDSLRNADTFARKTT